MNLLHKPHDWYIDRVDGKLYLFSMDGKQPLDPNTGMMLLKAAVQKEVKILHQSHKYRPDWFQRLCEVIRQMPMTADELKFSVADLQAHANRNPYKFTGCNHTPRTFNHGKRRLAVLELAIKALID